MKASEKRQILQGALQGKANALRHLQQQRQKDSMPFREVIGIVLVTECPIALLDVPVVCNSIDALKVQYEHLSEYVNRWTSTNENERKPLFNGTFGFLDPTDSQYDLLPLSALHIKHHNYTNTHRPGGTIGELRRLHAQSKESLSQWPFIPLLIETDFDAFNWDVYNIRRS